MLIAKDDIIKEEILDAAQQLFRQFGLRKTTMEDIARSMGKGKSTLYYYYCSKEEIFDAVIRREMQQVFNSVAEAVLNAVSGEEKLKAFAITKIKAVQKKANLYKIVRGEIQDNVYCTKHLHAEYDLRESMLVKEILLFGVNNGEFTNMIRKEAGILATVIVSSLRGLERDMFVGNRYPKLETRMDLIMGILMRGLRNTA